MIRTMIPGLGRDPMECLWIRISKKKPRTGTSSNASSPCEFFTWAGMRSEHAREMVNRWENGEHLGKCWENERPKLETTGNENSCAVKPERSHMTYMTTW